MLIKTSDISGQGTYATSRIKAGELVKTLSGQTVQTKNIDALTRDLGLNIEDPLQIGDEEFLILDYESKVINHSCHPNVGIRNKCDLYALRDILPGEEITYDYSTTAINTATNSMEMTCNCVADNCRKTIGDVYSLPEEITKNYITLKALPDFILIKLTTKATINK